MIAILLFAGLAVCTLAVLLARYGKRRVGPGPQRDSRPPLPRVVLRELTVELLEVMGFSVSTGGQSGGCLVGVREDALGETRYVAVISPAGDDSAVDQAEVLAAAETVKAEGGARGMLVTVGEIVTDGLAGLDVPLELVDRPRLRQLIAEHLPDRLRTLDGHRGFVAANKTASGEVPTDSDDERAEREDRWEDEGGVYRAPR